MKHFSSIAVLMAAMAGGLSAEEKPVRWRQLDGIEGRAVRLELKSGEVAAGWARQLTLASIEIAREGGGGRRTIAAAEVRKITVTRKRRSERLALRRSVGRGFQKSLRAVPTPWGPFALAGMALTGGYYVAALPFCLAGDAAASGDASQPEREIVIAPEGP